MYCVIGGLAIVAACNLGGRTSGTHGAIRFLAEHRFGWILIVLLTLGLAGFAVWSLVRGVLDPERLGHDAKAYARRLGFIFTGFVYCGFVVGIVHTLLQMAHLAAAEHRGREDHATVEWTAVLMSFPLGRWAVTAVGLGMIVFAIVQVAAAWRMNINDPLRVSPTARRLINALGRFGLIARGVAFVPIGGFLVAAAYHTNPSEARGFGGALAWIRREPAGRWLLAIVAAGLIAFGSYQLILAIFRRIRAD